MRRGRSSAPEDEDAPKRVGCCHWVQGVLRRCSRRRSGAAPEEESGDLEMGGGMSMLVAERVRMIQDDSPSLVEERRPSLEVPRSLGPSVAERTAMFRKRSDAELLPRPAPAPRRPSAAAERLRSMRASPTCGLCGLDVFANEAQTSRGSAYHSSCLRCGSCGRSLVGVQWGKVSAEDDVMYCDEVGLGSCLRRLATAHLESAKEAPNQRLSVADAETTKHAKLRAVEVIGDELERIVCTLAPRCALCGGPFAASDRLVMQGMVKMHEACMRGTLPTGGSREEPTLTPRRALKDAPESLVVKVSPATGRIVTFFLKKRDSPEDACLYEPDATSRAPHTRKVDVATLDGAVVRAMSLGGADVAPRTTAKSDSNVAPVPGFTRPETALVATFSWINAGLAWVLDVRFAIDYPASTVTAGGATLRVTAR